MPRTLTIRSTRVHQGVWLLGFEQIPDRTGAESLRGTRLVVDAADLPQPGDDDGWYEDELRRARRPHLPTAPVLGEVTRLRAWAPPRTCSWSPSTPAATPTCRSSRRSSPRSTSTGGRVVVDPPEGLLELNA